MVPLFYSNFNFQRCRYQVKLSVDDIVRDLYGEKSKMNVRSILISRKRTVSLNEDNVNISCDLDRDDNSIDALMNGVLQKEELYDE